MRKVILFVTFRKRSIQPDAIRCCRNCRALSTERAGSAASVSRIFPSSAIIFNRLHFVTGLLPSFRFPGWVDRSCCMFSCTYPTRYSRVETFAQRHKTNNIVIPHNIVIPREGGNPGIIKNMDARQRHSGMTERKSFPHFTGGNPVISTLTGYRHGFHRGDAPV